MAVGSDDGVRVDSVVNLDNLQLMERRRPLRRVGRVRDATLSRICAAVAIAVGCDATPSG